MFWRKLPCASGRYKVGFTDYTLTNNNSSVSFRLYYPTESSIQTKSTDWFPSWQYMKGLSIFLKFPPFLGVPLVYALVGNYKIQLNENAPIASGSFPVAVFSHGLAGTRTTYSTLIQECVSNGCIIAAIEHRDGSAACTFVDRNYLYYKDPPADNAVEFRRNQLELRVSEVNSIINLLHELNEGNISGSLTAGLFYPIPIHDTTFLKNKLNLNNFTLFGHSFGASTTFTATQRDTLGYIKSLIAIDIWPFAIPTSSHQAKTQTPAMFINNELFFYDEMDTLITAYSESKIKLGGTCIVETIQKAVHQETSDFPILFGSLRKIAKVGSDLPPASAIKQTFEFIRSFIKL